MTRKTTYENIRETYFLHPRLMIAINLLIKIADTNPYLRLQSAAEDLGISISYVEQIARVMRENEIIASQRGPGGGAYLIEPLNKITMADLLDMFIPVPDDPIEAKLFRYAKKTCGGINLEKIWKSHTL